MSSPRSVGSMVLALVTAFLLSGIAAAGASAAKFEAEPSFPVKFTAKGGAGFLETAGIRHRSVTCTETEASGEVSSATEVKNVSVTFKGCFAEHLPLIKCKTKAKAEGEIVTNSIKAKPVNLDTLGKQVGLLFEPEVSGSLFAEFECKFGEIQETIKVKGSIIGKVPVTDLEKFTETLHLEFIQVAGMPLVSQVEGKGEKHVLLTEGEGTEPFAAEESGIQEAVPGSTTTTAQEEKKVKLIP